MVNVPQSSVPITDKVVGTHWYRFFTDLLRLVNGKQETATFAEDVADTVGAMVTGNTETNITVTYQDADNTLDFAVPAMSDSAAGVVEAAVQSEMEAGSSTTLAVTPGRQQFHPSAAKGWAAIRYDAGAPGLQAGYNISSLTDVAVGRVTVGWDVNFSSNNYAVVGMCNVGTGTARFITVSSRADSGAVIDTYSSAAALADSFSQVVAFGDQ